MGDQLSHHEEVISDLLRNAETSETSWVVTRVFLTNSSPLSVCWSHMFILVFGKNIVFWLSFTSNLFWHWFCYLILHFRVLSLCMRNLKQSIGFWGKTCLMKGCHSYLPHQQVITCLMKMLTKPLQTFAWFPQQSSHSHGIPLWKKRWVVDSSLCIWNQKLCYLCSHYSCTLAVLQHSFVLSKLWIYWNVFGFKNKDWKHWLSVDLAIYGDIYFNWMLM